VGKYQAAPPSERRNPYQRSPAPFPPDKEREMFEALKPESKLRLINKTEIEVLFYILKNIPANARKTA
jgi:hypothetical protein